MPFDVDACERLLMGCTRGGRLGDAESVVEYMRARPCRPATPP